MDIKAEVLFGLNEFGIVLVTLVAWVLSAVSCLRLAGDKMTYEKARWGMSGGRRFYYSDVEETTRVTTKYWLHEVGILGAIATVVGALLYFNIDNEVSGRASVVWTVLIIFWAVYTLQMDRIEERLSHVPKIFFDLFSRIFLFSAAVFALVAVMNWVKG